MIGLDLICLFVWSLGRFNKCFIDCSLNKLIGWLIVLIIERSVNGLHDCLVCLICCFNISIDWLVGWLCVWLIDWLIDFQVMKLLRLSCLRVLKQKKWWRRRQNLWTGKHSIHHPLYLFCLSRLSSLRRNKEGSCNFF